MKHISRSLTRLVLCAGILVSPIRASAEPSASDKETARALLVDGKEKMAAREYAAAHKKFRAAHDIMNVPTTGIELATAQEALGLLVEARNTALEVVRMAPQPDSEAFIKAREAARELAARILPRIPSLVIKIIVPPGVTPSVMVDDSRVPLSALGLPRQVNPGDHAVTVTAAGYVNEKRVATLKEGETVMVEIPLRALQAGAAASASTSQAAASGNGTETEALPADQKAQGVPPWAWASGAAGIVALGAGIGFAVDFAGTKRQLDENCPERTCKAGFSPQYGEPLQRRWDRDIGLMVTFGGLGVLGIGAGIAGIVTAAPASQPSAGLAPFVIAPWAGRRGGGAVVVGAF